MLFIWNLPKTTNPQERFLITRMGASKLYAERIRTRIIQAVGRCSRNPSDYSIVCVIGDTIQNDLTKPEKIKQFAPELRAEIQFGLENSVDYSSVDDVIEQARDFLERNQVWQGAEEYIVDLRNGYWNEENKVEKQINEKLQESAIQELKFQYALWKKDYKTAFEHACSIVGILNAPALNGYKCFWNYMAGCMAYYLFKNGQVEYKTAGIQYLSDALKENISIRWLSGLPEKLFSIESRTVEDDDLFFECIERIESIFTSIPTTQKLEKRIKGILDDLNSLDVVCEWNYEMVQTAQTQVENPDDFIDFVNKQNKLESLRADERLLDAMFDRTKYGKELVQLAEKMADDFIRDMQSKGGIDAAIKKMTEAVKEGKDLLPDVSPALKATTGRAR